jgi:probable rRNA maturation factor
VKITIKNLQARIPIFPKRIKKTALKALSSAGAEKTGHISFFFVDDRKIATLNRKYLRKRGPTDVLCFDISRGKKELVADIFISCQAAARNAKIYATSIAYEIYLYVVHGILHLTGYDDKNPKGQKIMQRKAEDILKCLFAARRA